MRFHHVGGFCLGWTFKLEVTTNHEEVKAGLSKFSLSHDYSHALLQQQMLKFFKINDSCVCFASCTENLQRRQSSAGPCSLSHGGIFLDILLLRAGGGMTGEEQGGRLPPTWSLLTYITAGVALLGWSITTQEPAQRLTPRVGT